MMVVYSPNENAMMNAADRCVLAVLIEDTEEKASAMLRYFGSLDAVLRADNELLHQKYRISNRSANRLNAAGELARRVQSPSQEQRVQVHSPADAVPHFQQRIADYQQERLLVATLDTVNHIVGIHVIYVGTAQETTTRNCEILRPAIQDGATSIIVAHTHPSGVVTPSANDIRFTTKLRQSADLLDIELLDHIIIVADGRWNSLRGHRLGFSH